MAQIETAKLTLTTQTRTFLESKVAIGTYASEDEAIVEALENLRVDVQARERWEQEVLLPSLAELEADPSSALSFDELQASLELARMQRLKAS